MRALRLVSVASVDERTLPARENSHRLGRVEEHLEALNPHVLQRMRQF